MHSEKQSRTIWLVGKYGLDLLIVTQEHIADTRKPHFQGNNECPIPVY
jgi:hypothetical protein